MLAQEFFLAVKRILVEKKILGQKKFIISRKKNIGIRNHFCPVCPYSNFNLRYRGQQNEPFLFTKMHGTKGFVVPTKSIVKIGITKIFCYKNKMFSSSNKTFGCCSKIFG